MKKAVLLIFWNRPEYTKKVFEQIRIAQPPRLYLASDGPRNEEEAKVVNDLREWTLSHVNWPCEVKTRFLERNSGGCAPGVSGAVTWLFQNEPDGIVFEDDVIPDQTFFGFCEELLDKYKDDKRIWHIAGFAPYVNKSVKESYYFGKIMLCWGWASWSDRWQYFTRDLSQYDEKNCEKFSSRKDVQTYWKNILLAMKEKRIDSWDYPWTFEIVKRDGLCIAPYLDLTSNIGTQGVHYSSKSPILNKKIYSIKKMVHPKNVEFNEKAIDYIYTNCYCIGISLFRRIWRRMLREYWRMKDMILR